MATLADNAYFLDTNILVYAAVAEAPFHHAAFQRLAQFEQAGVSCWVSRQVLREYLAILSRPQTFVPPVPMDILQQHIEHFQQRFQVADENVAVTQQLLWLLQKIPIGGKQIHDANIVATMLVYGISNLLTANSSDFDRFAELIQVHSLETR